MDGLLAVGGVASADVLDGADAQAATAEIEASLGANTLKPATYEQPVRLAASQPPASHLKRQHFSLQDVPAWRMRKLTHTTLRALKYSSKTLDSTIQSFA
jgi:hypothetical protein